MSHQQPDIRAICAGSFAPGMFDRARVMVTGGTSGIGGAVAQAFRALGASVTATGVSAAEVAHACAQPQFEGIDCAVLDVRDAASVAGVAARFDSLQVLVNCAGILRRGEELAPEVFASVVDVNLNGTMRVCTALRPALRRCGGAVVNMASMLSFFGGGLVPAYAASKGGIAQLTKSLAIAYAGDGIRVNAIAPGWVETPMVSDLRDDAARRDAIRKRTALKRWGAPADMVGPVVFLASPAAAYVTGTVLPVDGGYLVMSSDAA